MTRLFLVAVALSGVGCGRVNYELLARLDGSTPEDGRATAENADGAITNEGCLDWRTPGWTLTTPEPLDTLNEAGREMQPYLSRDGLTLYFSSDRPGGMGGFDIMRATRASLEDPFGRPEWIDSLNSANNEYGVALSADELTAYVATARTGGLGGSDIWTFSRESRGENWILVGPVDLLNTPGNDWDAFLSYDDIELYSVSDDPRSGDCAIFATTRSSSTAEFAPASLVEELQIGISQGNPSLSRDHRTLVFNSVRTSGEGLSDIFFVTRADRGEPWSSPSPVPTVNSPMSEGEPFVRHDGCELFFSVATLGGQDLFVSRFVPPT